MLAAIGAIACGTNVEVRYLRDSSVCAATGCDPRRSCCIGGGRGDKIVPDLNSTQHGAHAPLTSRIEERK